MNVDQKLTAIRDLIQQDVGNRGLARDPERNLINACPDDFANACMSIADEPEPYITVVTGFFIPNADPPAFETDGPLGALFLARVFHYFGIAVLLRAEPRLCRVMGRVLTDSGINPRSHLYPLLPHPSKSPDPRTDEFMLALETMRTHRIAIERVGPNYTIESLRSRTTTRDADLAAFAATVPESHRGRCFSMLGRDITELMNPVESLFDHQSFPNQECVTIGIGDGGNEIGMGKIAWDTIRRNIPNGDLTACRVPADQLIVAGVSNWGAYALAAGVSLLHGVEVPQEFLDPDREREILQAMVDAGPLVDGVTGKQEATVDGLSWDDYIKPLEEIGKIVRA
jgi:hypothetical protein